MFFSSYSRKTTFDSPLCQNVSKIDFIQTPEGSHPSFANLLIQFFKERLLETSNETDLLQTLSVSPDTQGGSPIICIGSKYFNDKP